MHPCLKKLCMWLMGLALRLIRLFRWATRTWEWAWAQPQERARERERAWARERERLRSPVLDARIVSNAWSLENKHIDVTDHLRSRLKAGQALSANDVILTALGSTQRSSASCGCLALRVTTMDLEELTFYGDDWIHFNGFHVDVVRLPAALPPKFLGGAQAPPAWTTTPE